MTTASSFGTFQHDINWSAILKSTPLTAQVKNHLLKVYSTLGCTVLMCALGCAVHISIGIGQQLLYQIITMGLILYLASSPDNKETRLYRFSALMAFGFVVGLTLGPLLHLVVIIDPRIIMTAFLSTLCIFLCFSLSAIFAKRRSYLHMGGFLYSALSTLCFMYFLDIFFHSYFIFQVDLYLGLLLFCGFIMFDTQLVIEKSFNGNQDYIWDAIGLFLDFANVFIRLVVILAKDKKKSNNNKD
jgi:FtsH-binding integral membrane protein